ncbi:Coatomer subunit zeta-1 [Histomonas meleagridis]|uniref:Coatomer subunit zeta-1 n=1 Tax=Histomonas meleagridis TaxID=135588 RepID=UPI003559E990|nr:Coatomer subunit zeta-1 [Histomonas meleagridis]KAH0796925.1 Coatomer subunit zeta-1 [Histomonas meleagridis]
MGIEDLTRIQSVFIYSTTGTRVIAKYYTQSIPEDQRISFEKNVFKRGFEEQFGEVMQHDEFIIVYREISDVLIFVVGDLKSNELLLAEVLETICTSLRLVYKGKVNSESLIRQIDLLYLLLDETIEQGFIFEGDPEVIAARTKLKDDGALLGQAIRAITGF